MWKTSVFLFGLMWAATAVNAVACRTISFEQNRYTVCEVDASTETLRLFLNDPDSGLPLGSFANVENQLERDNKKLVFAMNAGMYHQDRSPVGHYVENGKVGAPLITREGPGNFGLLPNGVFCIRDNRADVFETRRFEAEKPDCNYASQSGPMLVIDGNLHPRFLEDSDSVFIRNGVGTSEDGQSIWFAISENTVNFHSFARLFRDVFKVPQALYFDGNISKLYTPELDRHDGGVPMGPIVGVISADK